MRETKQMREKKRKRKDTETRKVKEERDERNRTYPGSLDILGHPFSLNSSGMDPSGRRVMGSRPGT